MTDKEAERIINPDTRVLAYSETKYSKYSSADMQGVENWHDDMYEAHVIAAGALRERMEREENNNEMFVKLKFKPKDKVWIVEGGTHKEITIDFVSITQTRILYEYGVYGERNSFTEDMIGLGVFLTEEEAKKEVHKYIVQKIAKDATIRGHWISAPYSECKYECPICEGGSDLQTSFCPHCGSRLNEED